jgi:hypothetical protein
MAKRDSAQDLYSYVSAVKKQGVKLLVPAEPPRTVKDARRNRAAVKLALKKASS